MENPSSIMLIPRLNFEFGFNDADFSDRVLHIEITHESSDSKSNSKGGRKRKRKDSKVKVKTLHINSLLLAANSPFFHKSQQRDATLRISASEEAGVMELLNFMYTNTLKAKTIADLLGVLVVADKFEATDCVSYCCESLKKIPMSLEYALMYLELPASVLVSELVQPLIDAAKKYLCAHFKDFKKFQEEAMTLPLSAVEVLLSNDSLQVDLLGDDLFDFILKYARAQYPKLNQRREILTKNLTEIIRFRHMSSLKLKEVLVCPDLDRQKVSKLMLDALILMVEDSYGQRIDASNKYPIVKVEQHGTPQPRCVVYFDLKKEDCENLSLSRCLYSRLFRLGGRSFYLLAECIVKDERPSFGLYLLLTKGSQICTVDIEFEAMKKSSMKFQNKRKTKITYSDTLRGRGFKNLFNIQWTDFMGKESDYFIDGILYLRADITIKDSQA